jgi:hypothetical protein
LAEVEAARADERVEAPGGELADLGLERGDPPRREDTREEPPVQRVRRRILEDQRPRRLLDAGLDDLEDVPAPRDEGLGILDTLLDIVEVAQRVEVVRLVVVQRRLVP